MAAKRNGRCSFCGQHAEITREHVVPLGLFPDSTRPTSKFVLIPSCEACNKLFAAHEDDFRNYCTLAGPDSDRAKELFHGPLRRSFAGQGHGKGVIERIHSKMRPAEPELPGRFRIYPDDGVLFILRKIIRGLAFNHFSEVFPDDRVHVEVLRYEIPEEFDTDQDYTFLHPDVFCYRYVNMDEVHSIWVLKILGTRVFMGYIMRAS